MERVLAPVIGGEWDLARARQEMILSSPLYFANDLPATLVFSGTEDNSVPSRNAEMLSHARMSGLQWIDSPMAGHDGDPLLVARMMPAFLARNLGTPLGTRMPGADGR